MASNLKHGRRHMIVRLLRFHKEEQGAVMVEFAIIAPLFIFLITGTIQLMGMSHADSLLQYANFMALRAGTVHYENIARGWDPNRSGGSETSRLNDKLTEVMEDAAWHGLGPFASGIAGYEDLSSVPTVAGIRTPLSRAISHAPAAAFNIDVTAGRIDLGAQQRYLPIWLTSQTRIDLGLPMPWVGTAIAGVQRTDQSDAPTPQEMAQRGMDPFSNVNNPFTVTDDAKRVLYNMDFIPLTSDANLDRRTDNYQKRTVMWPLNVGGITVFHGGPGTATHGTTIDDGAARTQPAALPIQSRFRQ
ncbi:pilus assembly protein [Candidatus Sumerlaeota bacterium]|nr:pilus assembly protein [Candidatus Sumerlaeota bacterium]